MKVLHVLYSGLGGHGNVFFSMVADNRDQQITYEALFYGIEDVRQSFVEECENNNIPWYFVKKRSKFDLNYYRQLLRIIRKSSPDIIFLHGSAYILPAKLASVFSGGKSKIVIRETQANHLKTFNQWLSLGISMFLAHHIVCLTPEFREQIKAKLGWVFRGKKVSVISNGIDLDLYRPKAPPARPETVIGMQSRLVRIKDHFTLLKAFRLLIDEYKGQINLRMKIAGDGETRTELMNDAKESGIDHLVEFTGMLPENELVDFLQSLDLYVHASFGETMSTAIMQAMACRLPIVASDVNGINNMLKNNETGLLVPPLHEEEMKDALKKLLENPAEKTRLSENAYRYALENFPNSKMMEAYNKIFIRLTTRQ